jgi:hypothetical protein
MKTNIPWSYPSGVSPPAESPAPAARSCLNTYSPVFGAKLLFGDSPAETSRSGQSERLHLLGERRECRLPRMWRWQLALGVVIGSAISRAGLRASKSGFANGCLSEWSEGVKARTG